MRHSRITAVDVARKAGVSQTTVSVVLSGRERSGITEETSKRVRDAATILGYRPHGLARALARGRTDVVGVVLFNEAPESDADSHYLRSILNHLLLLILRSKRNPMLFASLSYDPLDPNLLSDGRADSYILISPPVTDPVACYLDEKRIPFVAVGTRGSFSAGAWVDADNEGGAEAAMRHLLDTGHSRIAHMAGPRGHVDADLRRRTYSRVMRAEGHPVPRGYIADGQFIAHEAEQAATALLARRDRPTAVFAGNDNMAAGVYRAANKLGLRIPEDLSVVGFDDIGESAQLSPPLTTVRQPMAELAERTIELLNGFGSTEVHGSRTEVVAAPLVERGSVAPPCLLGGRLDGKPQSAG